MIDMSGEDVGTFKKNVAELIKYMEDDSSKELLADLLELIERDGKIPSPEEAVSFSVMKREGIFIPTF